MDANCHNTLEVEGNKKETARFVKTIKSHNGKDIEEFNIGDFLPYPKEFVGKAALSQKQLKKKYGFDDFDDWCVANWGTSENCEWASYDKNTHTLEFDSYDSPPKKAVLLISKLFPKLTFHFSYVLEYKSGGESGSFTCKDGQIGEQFIEKIRVKTNNIYKDCGRSQLTC